MWLDSPLKTGLVLVLLTSAFCQQALWTGQWNQAADGLPVLYSATPGSPLHPLGCSLCALYCLWDSRCGGFNCRRGGRCQLFQESAICDAGDELSLLDEPGSGFFRSSSISCASPAPLPWTCLDLLRARPSEASGVKQVGAVPMPVYCDMDYDGGGWTLVFRSVTYTWTAQSVRRRNEWNVTSLLGDDYSILDLGHLLFLNSNWNGFFYRLEGSAETGRRQWGGIWKADRVESLIMEQPRATTMVSQFSSWVLNLGTIESYLPWLVPAPFDIDFVLTTSANDTVYYGTLCSTHAYPDPTFNHSPWILPDHVNSGVVLYWIKEE